MQLTKATSSPSGRRLAILLVLLIVSILVKAAPSVTVPPLSLGEGETFSGAVATIDDGSDGTPNSRYVTRLTQELFGRNATSRDVALAAAANDGRLAREEAAYEWITTTAFLKLRAQQLLLAHFPGYDISGAIDDTTRRLAGGFTEEEIRATLIGGASYAARFNNNGTSILNGLYQELLGRSPSNAEKNGYNNWISSKSRASYALDLMQHDEYRQRLTSAAFATMLGRQPTADELAAWWKLLASGGLRTPQLTASLAGMPEFAAAHPDHSDWLATLAVKLSVTNPPPLDLLGRRFETIAGHGQRAYAVLTGQEYSNLRIQREFSNLLLRAPNNAEVAAWVGEINSWPGLEYLVPVLVGTADFYNSDFDYGFVSAAFPAVMGRFPTTDETTFGTDFLAGGGTRSQYAAYLGQSAEHRTNYALGLLQNDLWFTAATNRVPSLADRLNLGVSPLRVRAALMGSFDYAEKARTNTLTTNFVNQLYQDVLGRDPTNGNQNLRLASLAPSRILAIRSVMYSEAYASNTLASYTKSYLKRSPTTAELNEVPPTSLQPGYIESIRIRLLGSDEFFSKSGGTANGYVSAVLGFLIPGAATGDWIALYNANAASKPAFITKLLATPEYRRSAAGKLVEQWLKRSAGPQEQARYAARIACGWDAQDLIAAVMAGDEYYELNGGTPSLFQQAALASLGLAGNMTVPWPVLGLSLELNDGPRLAAERFMASLVFRTNVMSVAHTNWLGRAPTSNEMAVVRTGWTNGLSLTDQWSDLLGSADFFAQSGAVKGAFVDSLTSAVLGRHSGAADLALLSATLTTNGTRADFVRKVLESAERGQVVAKSLYTYFLNRNPQGAETTNFVRLHLAGASIEAGWAALATLPDVQSLTPDSLGFTLWNAFSGTPFTSDAAGAWAASWKGAPARANLASMWSALPLAVTNRVAGYFQSILGRAPVQADLDNALARLGNGETLTDLRARLFASAEFYNKAGSVVAWVNAIHQKLFGRQPTNGEQTFWLQQINGGLPLQTAATSLLGSYEGRTQTVRDAGLRILDRPLSELETALESGLDRDGSAIVRFLASEERYANSQTNYDISIAWGNGVTNAGSVLIDAGVQKVLGTNVYPTAGLYPLKVTATAGTVSFAGTNVVTVTNVVPAVSFSLNTLKFNGVLFSIDGSFTDPGVDTWSGEVNYGDGTPAEALAFGADKSFSLSHVYVGEGSFVVTVTVRDTHGGMGTAEIQVPATPNQPPIVRYLLDGFATAADGWVAVSANGSKLEQPVFHASGGNPGGYISTRGSALGEGFVWRAPARYQGNKVELLGGVIAFDVRKAQLSALTVPSMIILKGDALSIVHHAALPPDTNWFRLQFRVAANEGWTNTVSGAAATLSEIQSVLNGVRRVEIAADLSADAVGGDLDNFVFAGTDPGPAPLLRIAPRVDGKVLLVWPTRNDTYLLQRAFDPGGPWEYLSGITTVGADGFRFFHQPTGTNEFYRLIK